MIPRCEKKAKQKKATRLTTLWRFLVGDSLLFTHSGDDGDEEILALVKVGLDQLAELAVGNLDIVLRGAILSHQVQEAVINVNLGEG